MQLREYQQESINKIKYWFGSQLTKPVLVLPTGSGKTIVFATLIKELFKLNPKKRFLILAHRQELVSQARDKLLSVWPCAPCSVMAASLNEYDATAPIVIASRDTIASKKRLLACEPFDLIVIDEAHHVAPDKSSRYRKILSHLEEIGEPYVMGVTATPYRMGQGYIYGMEDHYFGGVAHQVTIPDLIDQGYLCRLSAFAVADSAVIDASSARVKFKGGDYRESDLELIAMEDKTIVSIIDDWVDKAFSKGRTSSVFFCVTVAHAYKMCMYLKESGIKAEAITAETPAKERKQILKDFESGKINVLCNVAVLTEGWDAPRTDCVVVLRPTKSLGLYVQICGRGMRTWGDKTDCLLLDYGENMQRHGCIDTAKPSPVSEGEEERDKIWICDSCLRVNDWDDKTCLECGDAKPKPAPMEEEEIELNKETSDKDVATSHEAAQGYVLSDELKEAEVKEETRRVSNVLAEATVSANGNLYCKVKFMTYDSYYPYSLPLMIGMSGKAGLAAHRKWSTLTREKGYEPDTVHEAVELINSGVFDSIREIVVRKEGKYWNVVNANF